MSAKEDRAAQAAKVLSRPARTKTTPPPAKAAKPVRITLDLDPAQYRELTATCTKLATQLNTPRVTQAAVLRALIEELTTTPALHNAIAQRLQ